MTAIEHRPVAAAEPDQRAADRNRNLTLIRRIAVTGWVAFIVYRLATTGIAFNRELLLFYICTGLVVASIGRRKVLQVLRDWLPFALVLIVYDLSRGAADFIGRPTMWHWQADADRWMFFGVMPTVWLQERLKQPHPPWWEVVISTTYMSFFIVPYVIAGVLWLRNRDEWRKFAQLFVILSFTALAIYALVPAAPPWAAARCAGADVATGPASPACMFRSAREQSDGGILGAMSAVQPGAHNWIERISTRGWAVLNLDTARALIDEGQASVNLVAAIPSLHAGLSAAIAIFLWRRVSARWRPLLVAYPLVMAFTLVYSAEHYVIDILLGWVLAVAVTGGLSVVRGRRASAEVDLAQGLGDGPAGLGAGGQAHHVAGAQGQAGTAVGELDGGTAG